MAHVKVLAFAGSLRAGSYNRALIELSRRLAPDGMEIQHWDLKDIPVYNMDLETSFPASVTALKQAIRAADGVLMAVPEHNYSFSGVLKNAIDWVSRPYGDSALDGKPVILQSAAMSFGGGMRAQYHLRQVLGYFSMQQMYFPEVFVGAAHKKFDEKLELHDEVAVEAIRTQLAAFKSFIEKVNGA